MPSDPDYSLIDAHAHLPLDTPKGEGMLSQLGMKVMNICVDAGEVGSLEAQRGWYRALKRRWPGRFAWCTSFPVAGFGSPGWADRCINQLAEDFDDDDGGGAIACKVWKNVGMELRDPESGAWVMVDDSRFTPIFAFLARIGRPLLMHIGEPMACWRPLDPASPHFGYFSANPQWHWHGRTDVPDHGWLMSARDRVITAHPDLRIIGAHFGSHEYDLAEVAHRLERYPNYCVDTSARLGDIAQHARADRPAVRDFFAAFADRVLWGVDWVLTRPLSTQPQEEQTRTLDLLADQYELERRFYATDGEVLIHGKAVRGLALSAEALGQIRAANARRVYTGV